MQTRWHFNESNFLMELSRLSSNYNDKMSESLAGAFIPIFNGEIHPHSRTFISISTHTLTHLGPWTPTGMTSLAPACSPLSLSPMLSLSLHIKEFLVLVFPYFYPIFKRFILHFYIHFLIFLLQNILYL